MGYQKDPSRWVKSVYIALIFLDRTTSCMRYLIHGGFPLLGSALIRISNCFSAIDRTLTLSCVFPSTYNSTSGLPLFALIPPFLSLHRFLRMDLARWFGCAQPVMEFWGWGSPGREAGWKATVQIMRLNREGFNREEEREGFRHGFERPMSEKRDRGMMPSLDL